ncbi:hypothetical protein GCM10009808_07330 [Microbacterium sediminicola]|uniref:Uncharacterized protein n=1 Tax=Microbacterium sediminicola TaxID=415210 RepID=A0ABP4TSV4_9MICO
MALKTLQGGHRERRTTIAVWAASLVILAASVGWAFHVEYAVPNACTYDPPPENAQYIHCD